MDGVVKYTSSKGDGAQNKRQTVLVSELRANNVELVICNNFKFQSKDRVQHEKNDFDQYSNKNTQQKKI